jgi:hypothetical protein
MADVPPSEDPATPPIPPPGSPQELEAFRRLQARLPGLFRDVFADPGAPRTVVVIPSLSLDQQVMARIAGVHHYEERMLPGLNRSSQHQPDRIAARRREPRQAFANRASCAVCC